MSTITIRPRTPDDDHSIVVIENRLRAPFPPRTLEEYRHNVELGQREPRFEEEIKVAERDGLIVGVFSHSKQWEVETPGAYWAEMAVDPDLWGQGIGTRMFEALLARLEVAKAERIYGEVREDHAPALEFARRRSFNTTGRAERLSVLDVHGADLTGYEGIEERVREGGITIASLAEYGADDERFLRELHQTEHLAIRDIPSSETPAEPWPFELWRDEMLTGPGRSTEFFWVARDDLFPVGLARLRRRGVDAAFNGFTGVHPQYRGRGIARALKLRTIEWSRRNGVNSIYTGNDMENQRMLAINIKLGYTQLPGVVEVMRRLPAQR